MGSNAVNLVDEDLCCPVCKKPLSSPGNPPKPKLTKIGRGKGRAPHLHGAIQAQRDKRMAVGKFKDNDEIVVAQCGHLYHKFCLRHFCYLVREGRSNHMCKVNCPWCNRQISMSSQTIDYRAHQDRPNDRDREYTKTSIMNNELSGQMTTVQQRLQRLDASIEDGNHNFEIYRSHWKKLRKELKSIKVKRLDIESLYSEIERSEQMLKCMQKQQLKIVKKFILKVRDKAPKDYIHFPRRLAPFLNYIHEDDRLIRDLGEIIVPIHLNHLKSDRQSLLQGIISTVNEKMVAKGNPVDVSKAATSNHVPHKSTKDRLKKPAVFVKVRKSSISILSSMSLTRESIQKIIKTVKVSRPGSKKRGKSTTRPQVDRPKEKVSNNKVDNVSASDIKILYMPKRKMVEKTSEPCRNIEESDSYSRVPVRKCKSADAVLVKTKKKQGHSTTREPVSKATLNVRRSMTAVEEVLPADTENVDDCMLTQNKTCPTIITKYDSIPSSMKSSHNNAFIIAKEATEDAHTDRGNLDKSGEGEWIEVFTSPKIEPQLIISKPTSPSHEPNEKASLLKLIYDKLKEDQQQSNHNLETHRRRKSSWTEFDENNNELFSDFTKSYGVPNESLEAQTMLPLFRVDRSGIARPESPHVRFREPSFLSNVAAADPNTSEKFINSAIQPDEENQLNLLSSEEKFLVVAELEAFFAARQNCGGTFRRPMFHGIPACLGMPDGKCHFGTPPDPQCVPFYLKKWQQQLSSRKVLPSSRRAAVNSSNPSSRLMHYSPRQECRTTHYHIEQGVPHVLPSFQQKTEVDTVYLPPLSMYPVKRPTTAVCEKFPETYQHTHTEGPEREASRINDYKSNFWKYRGNDYIE